MLTFTNGYVAEDKPLAQYLGRKKNQVYKLLPLKEEGEDWERQLNKIYREMNGLKTVSVSDDVAMITILGKLGSLSSEEDFAIYRKTVFEILSLLDEIGSEENEATR